MLTTKIDLMKFAVEVLGYKDAKTGYRYFVKKFNEKMELSEYNNVCTVAELLNFNANGGSTKAEFKQWCAEKMKEILGASLSIPVERADFDYQLIAPKKATTSTATTTVTTTTDATSETISTSSTLTDESILDILGEL